MKTFVYSIYDVQSATYLHPLFCKQDGEASRVFHDLCHDENHPCGKHPADYTLVRIGTWNDADGKLTGDSVPEKIVSGLEILGENNAQ